MVSVNCVKELPNVLPNGNPNSLKIDYAEYRAAVRGLPMANPADLRTLKSCKELNRRHRRICTSKEQTALPHLQNLQHVPHIRQTAPSNSLLKPYVITTASTASTTFGLDLRVLRVVY
jgi:hypothetical protein